MTERELIKKEIPATDRDVAGDARQPETAPAAPLRPLSEAAGGIDAAAVRQTSDHLHRRRQPDTQGLLHAAAALARRDPLLFVGGAFLAGLLGARFLRSSAADTGIRGEANPAPPSRISDEEAARLLREAERAYSHGVTMAPVVSPIGS